MAWFYQKVLDWNIIVPITFRETHCSAMDTRSRQLCHPRSVTGSCTAATVPDSSHLQIGFYLELRSDQGLYEWFQTALSAAR